MYYIDHGTLGGRVVHSYGRLILNETVITDKHQLQPPDNEEGDGRIECRVGSGLASFRSGGDHVSYDTSRDIYQIKGFFHAFVVIRDKVFNNFENSEGECSSINNASYHYLFLSNGKSVL